MKSEYTAATEVWHGERKPADTYQLFESQPTAHFDGCAKYVAVLRIWRGGGEQGQHIEGTFDDKEDAKKAAERLQTTFQPAVTPETLVWC